MKLRVFTVDAFTKEPFSGNPAAVVPLEQSLPDRTLQLIAMEFNLSETTFITPATSSTSSIHSSDIWKTEQRFGLRWFSPITEIPLCGHATLAAAHALFACLGNGADQLEFETMSGILLARRSGDSIILDFPNNAPVPLVPDQSDQLEQLVQLVRDQLPVSDVMVSTSAKKLLVRIEDNCTRQQLESFKADGRRFTSLHDGSIIKGVIITLKGHKDCSSATTGGTADQAGLDKYDFVSRYFAQWNGIPEDPVTGSAHTVLGPYWSVVLGKTTLKCRQCSPRGGDLTVGVRGDARVDLVGAAVTVMEGVITI